MRFRALRDACACGFVYGALFYGAVLSLLHVVHNRLGSAADALIALAFTAVLYGLWSAAVFLGVAVLALPFPAGRRGVGPGLFVFNLLFWELALLYGLTYDEAPFHPSGRWGMAAVLLLLALGIAAAAAAVSWTLARVFAALRRRGRLGLAAAALAVLAIAVHAASPWFDGSGKASKPPAPAGLAAPAAIDTGLKVVVVGLDGADWRVITPMMEKGGLPAFAGLVRGGATADLATIYHSNSAVIWASIYTGDAPERHGVQDFFRIRFPGMSSPGLFPLHRTFFKELTDLAARWGLAQQTAVDRFSLRASPPLWEIADRAGVTTGVADGYFYSFPALSPSRPESWFYSYGLDEYSARPKSEHVDLFFQPRDVRLYRDLKPILARGDFAWQSGVLMERLARGPQPRLMNLYTHQPDSNQHWYWKWFQPDLYFGAGGRLWRENHDRIPGVYREFDAFLARLLAKVGPETVVIVVSDHGHSPTIVDRLYTQHWHGPPGILLMRGGPVKRGAVLQGATIYDVYPTVLYLLGLPVPKDAEGKVLLEALDPGFVRVHPVRTVPSYAGLGLSPRLPGVRRDSTANELEIEKLRSLGYIGM